MAEKYFLHACNRYFNEQDPRARSLLGIGDTLVKNQYKGAAVMDVIFWVQGVGREHQIIDKGENIW